MVSFKFLRQVNAELQWEGSVLSFSVGGTITTRGGNLLAVYMVAGTLWIIGLLYVWLVLPESFPKAKRDALRRERQRQVTPGRWRVLSGPAAMLAPLKHLAPVRDPQTGRRNWRLLICAVHMLLVGLGGGYAVASIVTIVTSLYQYKPHETGYMLTALSGTNMFVLTLAIPFLVRVLRPLYRRSSIQLPMGDDAEVVEATDRLDVHIAFVSWVTEAAACLIFGYMRTRATQLAGLRYQSRRRVGTHTKLYPKSGHLNRLRAGVRARRAKPRRRVGRTTQTRRVP